jgi:hypothetical protein
LAGNTLFDEIWEIPPYEKHYNRETGQIGSELAKNDLFSRMIDCEIVLRFFAFRDASNIRGSVKDTLDRCMEFNQEAGQEKIKRMRDDFVCALETSHAIFGSNVFKIKNIKNRKPRWQHSRPLFDAVMVSVHQLRDHGQALRDARHNVVNALNKELEDESSYEVIVGRPNTAAAVKKRIALVHGILKGAFHGRKRS